jgi:hypothetical protein
MAIEQLAAFLKLHAPGATTRRLESGECIPKHLGQ